LPWFGLKLSLPGELRQASSLQLWLLFPMVGGDPDPDVQDFDAAPDTILSNWLRCPWSARPPMCLAVSPIRDTIGGTAGKDEPEPVRGMASKPGLLLTLVLVLLVLLVLPTGDVPPPASSGTSAGTCGDEEIGVVIVVVVGKLLLLLLLGGRGAVEVVAAAPYILTGETVW